jgi:hypothetical protein
MCDLAYEAKSKDKVGGRPEDPNMLSVSLSLRAV